MTSPKQPELHASQLVLRALTPVQELALAYMDQLRPDQQEEVCEAIKGLVKRNEKEAKASARKKAQALKARATASRAPKAPKATAPGDPSSRTAKGGNGD